jgi:isochorismate synthase/2-succinyl-5-enolpyruvyl-6-hydroxy-3-cyclohexene-1-carboxylate synthase/2-succinyl-6-hydroxy-2,4-cyclohexadiene-1-carboxylate synthase/O-succinylbenzoate synthase
MQGLEQWEASSLPYTTPVAASQQQPSQYLPHQGQQSLWAGADAGTSGLVECLLGAKRGLLVVAQLTQPQDCVAALRIAEALGWPVAADILSGAAHFKCNTSLHPLAVRDPCLCNIPLQGNADAACLCLIKQALCAHAGLRVGASAGQRVQLLHHFDHVLLGAEDAWPALAPDVVLQLGGRLTSKRAAQFLEWAAQPPSDTGRWGLL